MVVLAASRRSGSAGTVEALSQPLVFAHRGAAVGAPSGSLEALRRLAADGICHVDVDAFRTRDAHLVIGHPAELRLDDSGARSAEDLSLDELRGLAPAQSLPTAEAYLREASLLCSEQSRRDGLPAVLVEPKGRAAAAENIDDTLATLARASATLHAVGVWLERADAAARAPAPLVPILPIKAWHVEPEGRALRAADVPRQASWRGSGPYWRMLTPEFADAHRLNRSHPSSRMYLFTWVVDTEEATRTALGAGVDAIISDDAPAARRAVLRLLGHYRRRDADASAPTQAA